MENAYSAALPIATVQSAPTQGLHLLLGGYYRKPSLRPLLGVADRVGRRVLVVRSEGNRFERRGDHSGSQCRGQQGQRSGCTKRTSAMELDGYSDIARRPLMFEWLTRVTATSCSCSLVR